MIVAFWTLVNILLDSPERRMRMEARRMAELLKKYDEAKKKELLEKYDEKK